MFSVLLTLLFGIISYLLWRRYRLFQLLTDLGYKGPQVSFITGNYFEIKRRGLVHLLVEWHKKYNSDIVGYYYGDTPILSIKNLDLTKQILVKQFSKFTDRHKPLRLEAAHPVLGGHILFALGSRWKATRNFMTPSFNTLKMRTIFERQALCVDEFMKNIRDSQQKYVNVYAVTRRLTMDSIARGAFSIITNVQKDGLGERPKFQEAGENSIDLLGSHWLAPTIQSFKSFGYYLQSILGKIGVYSHPQQPLVEFVNHFLKMRRESNEPLPWLDFMQTIVNAGRGEDVGESRVHSKLEFNLNESEVVANCLQFFLAAFETTSSAMSFMYYLLAAHPEVQKKLRRSLLRSLEEEPTKELSYEFVMGHQYLDMIVNESLRLYPTANGFLGREANEDFEYKGWKIPKGVNVLIPAYLIHRDEENYENPDVFEPERFSVENKGKIPSMAYIPFGEGQRSCIGNRFALMQMKLAAVRTILEFDLEVDQELHKNGVEIEDLAAVIFRPKYGVSLRFIPVQK